MRTLTEIVTMSPVIPVVTLAAEEDAVPIAKSLFAVGIPTIEITMRSDAALGGIARIRGELSDMVVGAGTVWTEQNLTDAENAGAQFAVSPGAPSNLRDNQSQIPLLLGAQTLTEVYRLAEQGFSAIKFYPAEAAGGSKSVKAIGDVLPDTLICPTGGIAPNNAQDYLRLSNVPCVGGSWLIDKQLVSERRWDELESVVLKHIQALR